MARGRKLNPAPNLGNKERLEQLIIQLQELRNKFTKIEIDIVAIRDAVRPDPPIPE